MQSGIFFFFLLYDDCLTRLITSQDIGWDGMMLYKERMNYFVPNEDVLTKEIESWKGFANSLKSEKDRLSIPTRSGLSLRISCIFSNVYCKD
jgi:hypothetical protein